MKESALKDESYDHSDEVFEINLHSSTSKNNLSKLKQLLADNQGETPVLLIVDSNTDSPKKIKLQTGLFLSPSVKSQILALIK